MEKYYSGYRVSGNTVIDAINQKDINDRYHLNIKDSLKLRNHSPTGFEWGYHGSGPGQTALAILLDCMGEKVALEYYQDFKREIISKFHMRQFFISDFDIKSWLKHKGETDGK